MDNVGGQLELLDVLTIVSFVLQLQNQQNIIGIRDVQKEVDRAIGEIHAHLEMQDTKIDRILEVLNETNQETVGNDRM